MKSIFTHPNEMGYYGSFGGAYIPEMLHKNVSELQSRYLKILKDKTNTETYQINGGFVETLNNKTTVLLEGAVADKF